MSLSEIRGYIRALASECVGGEVEQTLSRRRLGPALRTKVADAAVNQLVTMVAHDVLTGEAPAQIRPMAA